MKYCEDFAALLDPYIDGELSPEETARVREHLRSCDGCRAYVQAALTMRDAFPEAEDTEVPEGFAEGVMAAIRADAAPRKRRRPRWQKTLLPLAACCAVVILAVSGLPRSTDTAVRDTAEPRVAAEEAGEPAEAEMSGEEDASIADAQAEETPPQRGRPPPQPPRRRRIRCLPALSPHTILPPRAPPRRRRRTGKRPPAPDRCPLRCPPGLR